MYAAFVRSVNFCSKITKHHKFLLKQTKPGIEGVQALADISRSAL